MKNRNTLSQLTLSNNIHSDVDTHEVPTKHTKLTNITRRKNHIYTSI